MCTGENVMSSESQVPRFVEQRAELDAILGKLPLLVCAHCGRSGNLVGHGFLRGYMEHGSERVVRGRRILCSGRGRKRGCGRTVSTLLTHFIQGCVVTALSLWALFCGLAEGLSVERAASKAPFPLAPRSAYRTAAALRKRSFSWRSWLSDTSAPPATDSTRPLGHLSGHLILTLGSSPFESGKFRQACRLL
jgi:hypothetical protein